MFVATSLLGLYNWQSHSNLSSGIFTRASLGSMVQNGKFSAGIDSLVRVLKRVDFPTFGNPTIPIFRWDENRPRIGLSAGTSFDFFGGIFSLSFFLSFCGGGRNQKEKRACALGFCSGKQCSLCAGENELLWRWLHAGLLSFNPISTTQPNSEEAYLLSSWCTQSNNYKVSEWVMLF